MKKKEYISPDMMAVELKAKHQLLVGSGGLTSKKLSVKYKLDSNDPLEEIDGEDEELD